MGAGSFNCSVRIERRVTASKGGAIEWELVAKTKANVLMLSGRELLAADAPIGLVRASVRVRYRKDIRKGMRITIDDLVMRIEAVLPDLTRREHVGLVCVSDER